MVAQLLEWGGREAVLVQVKSYCSQTRAKVINLESLHTFHFLNLQSAKAHE
jgi:hypothetical protein